MVALLTPAVSATASMLTAPSPRSSSNSAAASRIAWRAFSLRGRPRFGAAADALPSTVMPLSAGERRLARPLVGLGRRRSAEAGEYLVQRRDVALAVAELARLGQHMVRGCRGRERDVKVGGCLQREAEVLVHQLHVEPCALRQVEPQGDARLEHRRADRALAHDPRREPRIDAAALG